MAEDEAHEERLECNRGRVANKEGRKKNTVLFFHPFCVSIVRIVKDLALD